LLTFTRGQITFVREIPAYAGFYAGYESSKRAFQKNLGTQSLPVWATLTSGAIGGLAYWIAWCAASFPLSLFNETDVLPFSATLSVRLLSHSSFPSSITLPSADVVKSRIQNAELPPRGANYIVNTFKEIYAREGAKAFVAGLTPSRTSRPGILILLDIVLTSPQCCERASRIPYLSPLRR
jgi:solute carrier family 25 carnitine/acylcarnitine transporter 20/29